jgi:hypothetical protein
MTLSLPIRFSRLIYLGANGWPRLATKEAVSSELREFSGEFEKLQ